MLIWYICLLSWAPQGLAPFSQLKSQLRLKQGALSPHHMEASFSEHDNSKDPQLNKMQVKGCGMPSPNWYIYNTPLQLRLREKSQKRKQKDACWEIAFPRHEGEAAGRHEISILQLPKQDPNNDNPVGSPKCPTPWWRATERGWNCFPQG